MIIPPWYYQEPKKGIGHGVAIVCPGGFFTRYMCLAK